MIDAHRGAFEYDWRTRLGAPLAAVGRSMTYGEAVRQTGILSGDPSSAVGAAIAGWAHPVSREAIVLMDLYDLQHRSKAKRKPKAYPRPWDPQPKRIGNARLSVPDLRELLDAHRGDTSHFRDKNGRLRDHRWRFVKQASGVAESP